MDQEALTALFEKYVRKLRITPAWDVRLGKDGAPDITAKACAFQSAADARLGDKFTWFSIWF